MIDYGREQMTSLSYTKGMILFDILYELIGEENFKEAIRIFYRDYNRKGATSDEFVNHVKKLSKAGLTSVFDDWVYGTKSSQYVLNGLSIDKMISMYRNTK
jgi:aminopeptidase N